MRIRGSIIFHLIITANMLQYVTPLLCPMRTKPNRYGFFFCTFRIKCLLRLMANDETRQDYVIVSIRRLCRCCTHCRRYCPNRETCYPLIWYMVCIFQTYKCRCKLKKTIWKAKLLLCERLHVCVCVCIGSTGLMKERAKTVCFTSKRTNEKKNCRTHRKSMGNDHSPPPPPPLPLIIIFPRCSLLHYFVSFALFVVPIVPHKCMHVNSIWHTHTASQYNKLANTKCTKWKRIHGRFDLTLSTSPSLSHLLACVQHKFWENERKGGKKQRERERM